jgi:voltage-gated potassium channel
MTDPPGLQHKATLPIAAIRPAPPATGTAPAAGTLSFPSRPRSPAASAAKRIGLAVGLLALASAIVYLGRHGYRDAAHPGRPLSVLGSVYYATVTLSTIGYGDIVPVTATARLVNTIVITPMRVVFLIILVGTTLQVLTERTRTNWRIARWRSKVNSQIIVIGYGTKGRSAVRTLTESGRARESIVVVDLRPEAASDATAAGLVAVTGDGTRQEVLSRAEIGSARQIVIAVGRDETAVLIALTVRHLNPRATIVAAVREEENQHLLRLSGADQVVVSSGAAGRLLAISAVRPAAGQVLTDLLDRGRGLDLAERPVAPTEIGTPAQEAQGTVIALLRGDQVLAADHPAARRLARGDRLILVSSHQQPIIGDDTTQPEEFAHASHHI